MTEYMNLLIGLAMALNLLALVLRLGAPLSTLWSSHCCTTRPTSASIRR